MKKKLTLKVGDVFVSVSGNYFKIIRIEPKDNLCKAYVEYWSDVCKCWLDAGYFYAFPVSKNACMIAAAYKKVSKLKLMLLKASGGS